jgi:hypothetical protein
MVFAMTANITDRENDIVEQVISWLRGRFPSNWEVARSNRSDLRGLDAAIDVKSTNGMSATLLVEARSTFTPRDVDKLLEGMTRAYRAMLPYVVIVAVADWISPQAQERLRAEGLGYVDLTGNAWLSVDNPTVFISAQGANRNPNPLQPGKVRIQGPKAGRLIRWLLDVRSPYGVREFAGAADLSQSYVSRVFEALDEEALVERTKRGAIESVDVPNLLRRWTDTYSVLKANRASTFIDRQGVGSLVQRLDTSGAPVAVTGSFAAVRRSPVAAPALLMLYTDQPQAVVRSLDLLPADQGANVVLLQPYDPVVWQRTDVVDGVTYVADSQATADCLTGNGRMPAEGQALLEWMLANESVWRLPSLDAATSA